MTQKARDALPVSGSLRGLASEAKDCRNCDLWKNATQTVFGEGSGTAGIMLVGEQLMDRLLVEAGICR